MLIEKEVSLYL